MDFVVWITALVGVGLSTLTAPVTTVGPQTDSELSPTGPRYEIARVLPGTEVELRSSPGGPVVKRVGAKTEFNSPRTFYVAERREGQLGVVASQLPNGRLGWIADDPELVETYPTSYSVRVSLARREVEVLWGDEVIDSIPVTIGRPGTETPPGVFSVTDGLAGRGVPGPFYGCCVLALSGHQTSLPEGWIGGDRIAIHGTPGSIGGAASLGCLRASDTDMVTLFALVPLGAPVFVEAV